MKIHTDNLTEADLVNALPEGVHAHIMPKGSRKRSHAFDVTLYVNGRDELHRRFGSSGGYGTSYEVAATWDEWGIWMDRLYKLDPAVIIGWYESLAHFVEMTKSQRDYVRSAHKPASIQYRTHLAPWLD